MDRSNRHDPGRAAPAEVPSSRSYASTENTQAATDAATPAGPQAAKRLPRRDIVLLPAIALLTWVVICVAAEGLARWYAPEQQADRCYVSTPTGSRFQPDCHSDIAMFESGWIKNDYNDCGFRSAHSCRTLPADTLRVAVLGTSISRGYWVNYPQTFSGRVEQDMSQACGRTVDVQNDAQSDSVRFTSDGATPVWHHVADLVPEALQLQPKALVLVMTPFDVVYYTDKPDAPPAEASGRPSASLRATLADLFKSLKQTINNDSRAMLLARHIGLQDDSRFIQHSLGEGDGIGYLRPPFDAHWQVRLGVADATIGRIAAMADKAHVPFIVVLMPTRVQAMLSADGTDHKGTDPFALGNALARITAAHHANFVDMTQVTRTLRQSGSLFYEINGHPNADGHQAMARSIEAALENDVPAFASCRRTT